MHNLPIIMFRARNIITRVIDIVFMVAQIFLLIRLLLKLLSANEEAAFVQWMYATSQPLLNPFEGIFPTVVESGIVIEFSTLFAIVIYALAAYLLIALIDSVYYAANHQQ